MNDIPSSNSSSPSDTERVRLLFQQVGELASTALHVSRGRADDEVDDVHADLQVLRMMMSHIAVLADKGDRQMGGVGSLVSCSDWMVAAD